ncbi:MAG: DUF2867 domain-containing protein [Woeseiaceae bacterium]|nr:DUF2867 domain-containing protein [Woeseiaceae bacterium]
MAAVDGKPDLVFGASGYIGTNLVEFLLDEGRSVRASARNIEVLQGRGWQGAQLCEADALKPESLDRALAGVDTAYYLVHSMAAGKTFPELDAEAARNFAEAAARHGVNRIVYLGGLTPQDPASVHLQSRTETGEILRTGSVPVTELRAGMIIGPGSAAWEVIRDLVNHLPVMVTPKWVFSRSTPIALSNLLRYLADVPSLEETSGEVYDVAGHEVLTYKEIMLRYGQMVGKRPYIIPVPMLTPRLSSYWLRLVTSVPTSVARALIGGLSQDVVAQDRRLESLIPQDLLDFDAAAAEALNADRRHEIPAHWVENAVVCETFSPDYGFYAKQASGETISTASAEAIWSVVCRFGNDGDFFYARALWWIRRVMDWLVGGPSFRRRRRHPDRLRVGDVIDAWRVIAMEDRRRLTLVMELRAPGAGVLEFSIEDRGDDRRVGVRGFFHPAGAWGLLYWYVTLPVHAMLFNGSAREIASRAEAIGQEQNAAVQGRPDPR